MNFSFWPFLWFGLRGRLLNRLNHNEILEAHLGLFRDFVGSSPWPLLSDLLGKNWRPLLREANEAYPSGGSTTMMSFDILGSEVPGFLEALA